MRFYSRFILAVILAAGIEANAQDVASDAGNAAKDTDHATAKTAEATGHGTEKAVKKTSTVFSALNESATRDCRSNQ